jgi:hypothetical protein
MANRPPPLFALSTVQEILRSYDKPITMGVIERELNLRHVEKLDSHKLKQRIHVLVHSGKIKAEPDSLDSRVRWYSLPDVTPPAPVKVEAAEPAPMEPPAPAEIVPVIDLKGTVNAIADAVAAAIGDVLRTRIEAVVHDQLQQALDSLPAQITQIMEKIQAIPRTFSCDVLMTYFAQSGAFKYFTPDLLNSGKIGKGDIFFVLNPTNKKDAIHVGLLSNASMETAVADTLEGNTNNDGSRDGVGVFARYRKLTQNIGIVDLQSYLQGMKL